MSYAVYILVPPIIFFVLLISPSIKFTYGPLESFALLCPRASRLFSVRLLFVLSAIGPFMALFCVAVSVAVSVPVFVSVSCICECVCRKEARRTCAAIF